MKAKRTTSGLLLIVVLAFVGFALFALPQWLVEQYHLVKNAGPVWVYVYFAATGIGAAVLLGCSLWVVWVLVRGTRRKRRRLREHARLPSELTAAEKQREFDENLSAVGELAADERVAAEIEKRLQPTVKQLLEKREQQKLEIVAFGSISGGKSSLLNALAGHNVFQTDPRGGTTLCRNEVPWPGVDQVTLVDTPGLGEVEDTQHAAVSAAAARDADIVLMVVDGPLRQYEHELLARLGEMEKRVLVCLNKEDWYGEAEKRLLLEQLRSQVGDFVDPTDVVAVRAQPARRTRVRMLADGGQQEEQVDVPADISALANRMMQIVRRDGHDLLLANLLLRSRGLVEDARARVREALDQRAWEIVNKYMWSAGGAAALSPFPVVDLLTGSAISTKMVIDLARVYRQEIDANTAVNLLGQLGKNLIGILGASAATPAVAAAVASLLKTVPGAGTIAGGVLQGTVQAIVTRWIGAVFIQYYRNEMQQPEGGLAALARREWNRVTAADELRKLVRAARAHWDELR